MGSRILLVRHGHTGWNEGAEEKFRGRADIDLDALGVRQAEATAARISRWDVAAIYSSPLPRAMTTARILASSLNIEPGADNGLIDIDYGTWQGLSLGQAQTQGPQLYSQWLESPHLALFPSGEGLEQVRSRVVAAVENVLSYHTEQTIVLVSHKVVCKVLMGVFLGLELSHFWHIEQHTCAINQVDVKPLAPIVTLLNDTSHLQGVE